MGLTTIGFGGRDGGQMKALCDLVLIAPTDSMELLEDLHLIYFHNLVCAMRPALAENLGVRI
jgi:D-sedoheptulose 7-phosphate isomerase